MGKKYYAPICPSTAKAKGHTYYCDHPYYNACTLYLLPDGKGLAVIQQRFNEKLKYTWWDKIDLRINIDISNSEIFDGYLRDNAGWPTDGLYPTVEVRRVMWALRLPPLMKHEWETRF